MDPVPKFGELTNNLVREQLGVILTVEIGFRRFRRVKLKTLSDTLTKDVTGGISFHDLGHSLLDQRLHSREPVTVRRP